MKTYQVGDILYNPRFDVKRKIAKVRTTGYSWYYPEWAFEALTPGGAENHFMSENSSDPFFEVGWVLTQ